MKQSQGDLQVTTRGKGLYEITRDVGDWAGAQQIQSGLCTIFSGHTSASLVIQESADAGMRSDFASAQLSIPVRDGRLALGTRQGIYVFEHRSTPRFRHVLMHMIGE